MGYRTVVILNNDQAHDWENDPRLGKKIAEAMNFVNYKEYQHRAELGYGRVVECAHMDLQTLTIIDGTSFAPVAHRSWYYGQTKDKLVLDLLKQAADELGYRLVKKSQKE